MIRGKDGQLRESPFLTYQVSVPRWYLYGTLLLLAYHAYKLFW